jgi:uncharacterized membrane protein (UPF0127 family)
MRTVTVLNRSRGVQIGHRIGCADGSLTRLVGLLGRDGLDTGGGLLLQPSSGIHTVGMRFTIDAVGLDAEMRVIKLWPHMKPNRVSSISMRVRSVLELPDGEIEACGIEVGHLLEVVANDNLGPQPSRRLPFRVVHPMGGMVQGWSAAG